MSRRGSSHGWLSGLLLVSGVALVAAVPMMGGRRVRLRKGDRVILLGDSLAQGLAPPLGQLVTEGGFDFASDAQQSTRVEQWGDTGRAAAAASGVGATVAIVSLGTNDAAANADWQSRFAGRAVTLIESLKSAGVRDILWVIPPVMPFDLGLIARGIEASGAAVFDSRPINVPRGPDAIHPTIAGAGAWAAALWESIR